MTQTIPTDPPTQPWGTPPPPKPNPQPKPALWRRPWIVGLAGLVVGIMLGGAIGSADSPTPASRPRAAGVTQATSPAVTDAPVETTPAETYRTPKPSDFTLRVKVLSKENFGEAGSNITFRVQAGWPDGYDPSKTYEVTYEVRGPEDGPMINTFTVTGDQYEAPSEEIASTSSTSTKLTAKVTAVEEV